MPEPAKSGRGVFASLRRLLRVFLGITQNRLELALVELQEWRWRFFDLLLLAGVVLILGAMTLLIATAAIIVICVETGHQGFVAVLALVYLAATILGFCRLRNRIKTWAPFSATLAELKKDKACLGDKS
jgi:uncharacterized membrane protein YqjE